MGTPSLFNSLTVMVIEDDPVQAEIYATILADQGFVPLVANHFRQASRMLQRYATIIDYIVCDNQIDGEKAGAHFRGLAWSLGIGCTVISATLEGEVDYLKPVNAKVFQSLVYDSLGKRA